MLSLFLILLVVGLFIALPIYLVGILGFKVMLMAALAIITIVAEAAIVILL